jgi:uncharacterized damage-inducible protein DinB
VNQKLLRLFNDIENQRAQLLNLVLLHPEKFDFKPNAKQWSIHQILAHLVTAESLTNQYIAKKIQGIDQAGNTGFYEELKMIVLKISQRLPFKFRAPPVVVKFTPSYTGIEELITEWDKTRAIFKQLLEQIGEDQLKRKIYKHVVAGRLNIVHAVLFLREHVTHHLPQVNNLLK